MHHDPRHSSLPLLDETQVPPEPLSLFKDWYAAARGLGLREPGAAALASATAEGRPSVRIVLLKQFDADGFVFYTNYHSRKGLELNSSPQAALVLYWDALERQVRIEGRVERMDGAESDAYFDSRPLTSRISAAASEQSRPIVSRKALIARVDEVQAALHGVAPKRPANWGGYRLKAEAIEFWQGRSDRLHDRVVYLREGAAWKIVRLQP